MKPKMKNMGRSTVHHEDRNIVVHRLAVRPDKQRQGIARRLMDFAEQWARDHEYDAIRLDTFNQNPGNQRFYLNRGYTDLDRCI